MIDAHLHHWQLGRLRYPWLDSPEVARLRADYLPADYRADTDGLPIEGWEYVQAEVDHAEDPVAETASIAELATETAAPGLLACVVYADLRADDLSATPARHRAYPLTRGTRQELWFDPASTRTDILREDPLSDPRWAAGYRSLAEHGLSFDLVARPAQLPQFAPIAADTPAGPVVLDHFGIPDPGSDPGSDPGLRTWRTGASLLAQLPHVHIKLSAVSTLGSPRDERAVHAVVDELPTLYGPRRCMIGSNLPVERLAGPFAEAHRILMARLDGLAADERDVVLAGTARRFYGTT